MGARFTPKVILPEETPVDDGASLVDSKFGSDNKEVVRVPPQDSTALPDSQTSRAYMSPREPLTPAHSPSQQASPFLQESLVSQDSPSPQASPSPRESLASQDSPSPWESLALQVCIS